MDIFEVGSKVWFVDENKPGVKHLLVTEEIVKKNLNGVSRDYLFRLTTSSGNSKDMLSKNMTGEFFTERKEAFDFMLSQATTAINKMLDMAEIKDKKVQKPRETMEFEPTPVIEDEEETIIELPNGQKAKLKGGFPQ